MMSLVVIIRVIEMTLFQNSVQFTRFDVEFSSLTVAASWVDASSQKGQKVRYHLFFG